MWQLIGKIFQKSVVYPKMSTNFSKIVRKQQLHYCNFFHVRGSFIQPNQRKFVLWFINLKILPKGLSQIYRTKITKHIYKTKYKSKYSQQNLRNVKKIICTKNTLPNNSNQTSKNTNPPNQFYQTNF